MFLDRGHLRNTGGGFTSRPADPQESVWRVQEVLRISRTECSRPSLSLLRAVVSLGAALSCNGSNAQVLEEMLTLIDRSKSVDSEVLAEIMESHVRRQGYQALADMAAKVPGSLRSKMRTTLATAAAQSRNLSESLGHWRLLPSVSKGPPRLPSCFPWHSSGRRCAYGFIREAPSLARFWIETQAQKIPNIAWCGVAAPTRVSANVTLVWVSRGKT